MLKSHTILKILLVLLLLLLSNPAYAVTQWCDDVNCQTCYLMESDTNPLPDSSQNSNTGALTSAGNPNFETASPPPGGFSTGYFDFDEVNDHIDADSNTGIPTGANERTFVLWVNIDQFDTALADVIFVANQGASNGQDISLFAEDNAISSGFQGHRPITPKATLSTGTWYHTALVIPNGATTTGEALIYIDGVNQSLSDEAGSSQTLDSGAADVILGETDSGGSDYNGRQDEFAVFSLEHDSTDINDMMDNGLSQAAAGRTRRFF